jgi:NAD(P)H-dependent FMN reductase
MTSSNRLLVFAGSTRRESFNRRLAAEAARLGREAGAQVTLLELGELDLPLYNADLEAESTPTHLLTLKEALFNHSGWVICSPEYNGSYTALLKNTLDWASRPIAGNAGWADGLKPFKGKVVGLLSASPGGLGGLRSLSHLGPLLQTLQCWVAPQTHALGQAGNAFDAAGRLIQESDQRKVKAVIDQVLWASARLGA